MKQTTPIIPTENISTKVEMVKKTIERVDDVMEKKITNIIYHTKYETKQSLIARLKESDAYTRIEELQDNMLVPTLKAYNNMHQHLSSSITSSQFLRANLEAATNNDNDCNSQFVGCINNATSSSKNTVLATITNGISSLNNTLTSISSLSTADNLANITAANAGSTIFTAKDVVPPKTNAEQGLTDDITTFLQKSEIVPLNLDSGLTCDTQTLKDNINTAITSYSSCLVSSVPISLYFAESTMTSADTRVELVSNGGVLNKLYILYGNNDLKNTFVDNTGYSINYMVLMQGSPQFGYSLYVQGTQTGPQDFSKYQYSGNIPVSCKSNSKLTDKATFLDTDLVCSVDRLSDLNKAILKQSIQQRGGSDYNKPYSFLFHSIQFPAEAGTPSWYLFQLQNYKVEDNAVYIGCIFPGSTETVKSCYMYPKSAVLDKSLLASNPSQDISKLISCPMFHGELEDFYCDMTLNILLQKGAISSLDATITPILTLTPPQFDAVVCNTTTVKNYIQAYSQCLNNEKYSDFITTLTTTQASLTSEINADKATCNASMKQCQIDYANQVFTPSHDSNLFSASMECKLNLSACTAHIVDSSAYNTINNEITYIQNNLASASALPDTDTFSTITTSTPSGTTVASLLSEQESKQASLLTQINAFTTTILQPKGINIVSGLTCDSTYTTASNDLTSYIACLQTTSPKLNFTSFDKSSVDVCTTTDQTIECEALVSNPKLSNADGVNIGTSFGFMIKCDLSETDNSFINCQIGQKDSSSVVNTYYGTPGDVSCHSTTTDTTGEYCHASFATLLLANPNLYYNGSQTPTPDHAAAQAKAQASFSAYTDCLTQGSTQSSNTYNTFVAQLQAILPNYPKPTNELEALCNENYQKCNSAAVTDSTQYRTIVQNLHSDATFANSKHAMVLQKAVDTAISPRNIVTTAGEQCTQNLTNAAKAAEQQIDELQQGGIEAKYNQIIKGINSMLKDTIEIMDEAFKYAYAQAFGDSINSVPDLVAHIAQDQLTNYNNTIYNNTNSTSNTNANSTWLSDLANSITGDAATSSTNMLNIDILQKCISVHYQACPLSSLQTSLELLIKVAINGCLNFVENTYEGNNLSSAHALYTNVQSALINKDYEGVHNSMIYLAVFMRQNEPDISHAQIIDNSIILSLDALIAATAILTHTNDGHNVPDRDYEYLATVLAATAETLCCVDTNCLTTVQVANKVSYQKCEGTIQSSTQCQNLNQLQTDYGQAKIDYDGVNDITKSKSVLLSNLKVLNSDMQTFLSSITPNIQAGNDVQGVNNPSNSDLALILTSSSPEIYRLLNDVITYYDKLGTTLSLSQSDIQNALTSSAPMFKKAICNDSRDYVTTSINDDISLDPMLYNLIYSAQVKCINAITNAELNVCTDFANLASTDLKSLYDSYGSAIRGDFNTYITQANIPSAKIHVKKHTSPVNFYSSSLKDAISLAYENAFDSASKAQVNKAQEMINVEVCYHNNEIISSNPEFSKILVSVCPEFMDICDVNKQTLQNTIINDANSFHTFLTNNVGITSDAIDQYDAVTNTLELYC